MAHRLTKQAITTDVPAIKEVVATPAYTSVTYEQREVTTYVGGQTTSVPTPIYGYTTAANGSKIFGIVGFTRPKPGKAVTAIVEVPVYTYHPAVAAVQGRDASTITDSQLGWNAGAQSVEVLSGDFIVRCDVSAAAQGVLVGIQPAGGPPASFNALDYAVLISPSQPPAAVEAGSIRQIGSPVAGVIEIRIERVGGVVKCFAGSVLAYTSSRQSAGDMVMSAVLYTGSDYVDNPRISQVISLSSAGEWGWGEGSADQQLRATSGWGWGGYASVNDGFARMTIDLSMKASSDEYSSVIWVMAEPSLAASGFNDVDLAVAVMALPMSMVAIGISVDIGSAADSISMTMRSGDYDYGEVSMAIDGIDCYALSTEDPVGWESVSEAVFAGDFYFSDPIAYAFITDGLRLGSSLELLLRMNIDLADHLVLMDDSSIGLIITAMIENKIGLADASTRNSRDVFEYINSITGLSGLYDFSGSTYSTNIVTGAVSRYAGFDFDGFCRVGMSTYGYRKDGLYLIGGEKDEGSYIGARADFGAEDFGTAQGKRVGNIFMGLATDGQVFVRTIEDGDQEMIYRAYERRGEFRADMQRGRASRFWRLRLEVVEGNYAELDNIEWVLTQTGRRST